MFEGYIDIFRQRFDMGGTRPRTNQVIVCHAGQVTHIKQHDVTSLLIVQYLFCPVG